MTDKTIEFTAPLIGLLGFLFLVGWAIATIAEGRRRMQAVKARAELNNRILEKYGSGREFVEFLQSEGGRKFLDSVTTEPSSPTVRVIGAMQKGVVAICMGLGLLAIPWLIGGDNTEIFKIFGILSLSLGAGFLISAIISYRLSRSLGLLGSAEDAIRPPRLAPQP